jgi:uncharacterized protein with HEPN domain
MRDSISDKVRLLHIIDAINDIETYFSSDTSKLTADKISRLACVKLFEIIGEAAYNVTKETKEKYNEVPWKELSGMRHILVHEYYDVDFSIIQQIIQTDIPKLKKSVNNILSELKNE